MIHRGDEARRLGSSRVLETITCLICAGAGPREHHSVAPYANLIISSHWEVVRLLRNDSEIAASFNRAGIAPRVRENLPRPAGHAVKRRDRDAEVISGSSLSCWLG